MSGQESAIEQIAAIGKRRTRARKVLEETAGPTRELARRAYDDGVPKRTIARLGGITRPTLDAWLRRPD